MDCTSLFTNFTFHLSEKQLERDNIFELYPPDGGGGFIMQQELGGVDDEAIVDKILHHNQLKDFGTLPALDYHKYEWWESIERSCWLNRLYFILPLARMAFLKKDAELAKQVVKVLLYFHRTQTAPATAKEAQDLFNTVETRRDLEYNQKTVPCTSTIPYQWYDFQPASRTIHSIIALWLIRELDAFTKAEVTALRKFIDKNARVIADQEDVLPYRKGNHQALRGLALLYAGILLGKERYLEQGSLIIEYHAAEDFYGDGLLKENSPTYHCFETWIMRDACQLAEKNGVVLSDIVAKTTRKAGEAIETLMRPDGFCHLINDGCNLRVRALVESILQRPARVKPGCKTLGGFSRMQLGKFDVLVDASSFSGRFSHYHAGKNGLSLWYDGKPFLVDSGCCNYDDPMFTTYFKQPSAHSTLLINKQGDGLVRGTYDWKLAAETETLIAPRAIKPMILTKVTSLNAGWKNIEWYRRVYSEASWSYDDIMPLVVEDFMIDTRGKDAREHYFTLIFNLHPDVSVDCPENEDSLDIILDNGGTQLRLNLLSLDVPADDAPTDIKHFTKKDCMYWDLIPEFEVSNREGFYCDGLEIRKSQQIAIKFKAKHGITRAEFYAPKQD